MALSDPARIPALQIVDALICMQKVRAAFAQTYVPFTRLTQQFLQAHAEVQERALLPETVEVTDLIKHHNKCIRGLQRNEAFFYGELYRRAEQPSEHAKALQKFGVLAKKFVSAPAALDKALADFKTTCMQP